MSKSCAFTQHIFKRKLRVILNLLFYKPDFNTRHIFYFVRCITPTDKGWDFGTCIVKNGVSSISSGTTSIIVT